MDSACYTNLETLIIVLTLTSSPATMVWLVNMADTDRPKRNSADAASPQQEAPEGERGVRVTERGLIWLWVVTFQTVRLLLSLTGVTCLQPWRPRLPPVCRRTTEASPPTGSTSRCTSWGHSSPPTRPDGRSRRCRPLVLLLTTTTRRVSAERRIFNILGHFDIFQLFRL